MRVHSRDGSKSIDGSGLELDDYVSLDGNKYNNNDKGGAVSSKYETFNTELHHGESVKSANTRNSRIADIECHENMIGQFQNINLRNAATAAYKTNAGTQNVEFFTIEDVNQVSQDISPSATQTIPSQRREAKIGTKSTSSKRSKKLKPYKMGNKSRSRSKKSSKKSINSSYYKTESHSKTRPPLAVDVTNRQSNGYSLSVHSTYSDEENLPPNNLYEDLHFEQQSNSTNIIPPYSMAKRIQNQPNVSPKRDRSFYVKNRSKTRNKFDKPCSNSSKHRSADKRSKKSVRSKLPPRYKNSQKLLGNSDQLPARTVKKVINHDFQNDKVGYKMYKQLEECQNLLF